MKFLLEGFVAHIRQAMERALEEDNDVRAVRMRERKYHRSFSTLPTKTSSSTLNRRWQRPVCVSR